LTKLSHIKCNHSVSCISLATCAKLWYLGNSMTYWQDDAEYVSKCTLLLNISHTHTHPFNGPFSKTTRVSRYQKGKTNLDFTEARDSGWQWHQLGHMQVCISLQTDNHASTPPLKSFLQAGCPSCRSILNISKFRKSKMANSYHLQKSQYLMMMQNGSLQRIGSLPCWI